MASKDLNTKIIINGKVDPSLTKAFQNANKIVSNHSNILKKSGEVAKKVAKVGATAIGAGAAAAMKIAKSSVESYAEYEQLVGGVETLFKDNAGKLIQYADQAYKTAGLSSNQYMSTITSFSASMINSLGGDTKKATELSNQAVIDMSDNANKMGTDMESIMNTYQSLSRGQYGMLDNLKLGYGGTKKEMERLLADAQKITGVKYDISKFSDVTQAIHVIQEKMGITGTTAKEASTTITGSISAMKGSWQNLLTAMSSDELPFDKYVDAFVESVGTVAKNLLPRIGTALNGVVKLVQQLAPKLVEVIPSLISQILPAVLESATSLINAIAQALPSLMQVIVDSAPLFINAFVQIFNVIIQSLPALITSIVSALPTLIPLLIDGLVSMIVTLCTVIPQIIQPIIDYLPDIIISIVTALLDNLPQLIEGTKQLVGGLIKALPQILSALWVTLKGILNELLSRIWTWLSGVGQKISTWGANLWAKAKEIGSNFVNGIVNFFKNLPYNIGRIIGLVIGKIILFGKKLWNFATVTVPQFISNVINWFKQLPSRIWTWLVNTAQKVVAWGRDLVPKGKKAATDLFNAIVNKIKELPKKLLELGKNIVQGLWNGIKNAKDWLIGKIKSFASGITDGIKEALGINSPSVVMEKLFKWVPIGAGNGIIDNAKYAVNAVKNMGGKIANTASKINPTIQTKVSTVKEKIKKFGTGGTVTTPQKAIVGDKPETIVPHGNTPRNRSLLMDAAKGVGQKIGGAIYNFTFAPVINGGNASEIQQMLENEEEKFKLMMDKYLSEKGVLAY